MHLQQKRTGGERFMKSGLLAAAAVGAVLCAAPASAQVKIGILNDQSGVYADTGGKYSLEAARMAVEDFGGEVLGQKIEIVTADHLVGGACGAEVVEGKEEDRHRGGCCDLAHHWRRLHSL